MEQNDLQRALMAVLFAAGEPVDAKRLSQTLEHDEDEIHAACKALMDELEGKFNYAPGPMDSQEVDVFDIGITVADVQGKTYWAAYIMRTPEDPTNDE